MLRALAKARRRRAGRNSAAGRRGRPRSAYEAPRAAVDRSTRFIGAESKRRGCPRLPAPQFRVMLLSRWAEVLGTRTQQEQGDEAPDEEDRLDAAGDEPDHEPVERDRLAERPADHVHGDGALRVHAG